MSTAALAKQVETLAANQASIMDALGKLTGAVQSAPAVTAPVITKSANGKIQLPKASKQTTVKTARDDERIAETVVSIGKTTDGIPVTLGFYDVETNKKDGTKGRRKGFGAYIGASHHNHTASTWAMLAWLAPLVSKAISERYE